MANYYTWLSIQSGFGLTISELGGLSSSTDPKLIASTLMALKDIISVEASNSGSSQFMTGSVENSSYGTFSISVDQSVNLIMSYIVSSDKGKVVDSAFVDLVTDLVINLGKQLTQFGQISDLVNSGARLPRSILIQAYLNSCTILRTERKLETKERQLTEGYKKIIKDLFNNEEQMLELIEETLEDDWENNDGLWTEQGVLKEYLRDQLIDSFSDFVVYNLANQNPDLLLYSKNPRMEQKIVIEMIETRLNNISFKAETELLNLLENEMGGTNIDKFLKKIPVIELHKVESQLQMEFVRRAFVKVIKKNPKEIFAIVDTLSLTEKFNQLLPELKVEHAGTFIYEGIKNKVDEISHPFIESFYNGFMQGMGDVTLSQTAMDMMIAFTQSFSNSKDLAKDIMDLENIEKTWAREIAKFVKSKTITNLQVSSIEEAVLLSNAAGSGIVTSLTKVLTENFFIFNSKVGTVLKDLVELYNLRGKSIKIATTLFGILEIFGSTIYSSTLITPTYKDFVFSNIATKKLKFLHNGEELKYNSKNHTFKSKENEYPFYEFIDSVKKITLLDDEKINISFKNINLDYFINNTKDAKIFINSSIFAAQRRFNDVVLVEYVMWRQGIDRMLGSLQSKLNQGLNIQHFAKLDLSPETYAHLRNIDLGEHIVDILVNVAEHVSASVQELADLGDSIKKETLSKGEVNKKSEKKLEKALQNTIKDIQKYDQDLYTDFESLIRDVEKELNNNLSKIKLLIQPSENDILKYNYSGSEFLPRMHDILPQLNEFMNNAEGIETEDINQLILAISLSLYESPPQSIFENSYDEIISGKRSKALKKVLGRVKTKKEFERYMKDRGETISTKLYNNISELINKVETFFVDKDGIVTSQDGNLFLNLGRLKLSKFPKTSIISDLILLKGLTPVRETSEWLVALNFTTDYNFTYDDPSIVTFSDAIRFITRKIFEKNTIHTFEGLAKVASMMEADAGNKINDVFNRLKNAIFNTEVIS